MSHVNVKFLYLFIVEVPLDKEKIYDFLRY